MEHKKMSDLKRESWIKNVMRIEGKSREEAEALHEKINSSEQSAKEKDGNPFLEHNFNEGDIVEFLTSTGGTKQLTIIHVERKVHTVWPYRMSDGSVMSGDGFRIVSLRQQIARESSPAEQEELHDPNDHPKSDPYTDTEHSVDVIIVDENGLIGLGYVHYETNSWHFHTDTLVDYNEPGNETKWKWYYPPITKI